MTEPAGDAARPADSSGQDDPEDHAALLVVRLFLRVGNGVMARMTTVDDVATGQETTMTTADSDALRRRVNAWLAGTVERLGRTRQ